MEALRIVVEFLGIVITAVLTYLFTRSHYERKRQDDLADRDFIRRAAIHDMRIKEARDYIDKLSISIVLFEHLTGVLKESNRKSDVEEEFEVHEDLFMSFPSIMSEMSTKQASIEILNDEEIKKLFKDLALIASPTLHILVELINGISQEEDDIDITKYKEGIDFDKIKDAFGDADKILTKIKARLDKLAEKVP
jgi:hypothetical protein